MQLQRGQSLSQPAPQISDPPHSTGDSRLIGAGIVADGIRLWSAFSTTAGESVPQPVRKAQLPDPLEPAVPSGTESWQVVPPLAQPQQPSWQQPRPWQASASQTQQKQQAPHEQPVLAPPATPWGETAPLQPPSAGTACWDSGAPPLALPQRPGPQPEQPPRPGAQAAELSLLPQPEPCPQLQPQRTQAALSLLSSRLSGRTQRPCHKIRRALQLRPAPWRPRPSAKCCRCRLVMSPEGECTLLGGPGG